MAITEITTQSYGSRLQGSTKGIVFGFLVFIVAFPLLFWNEGRAVKRHRALEEGSGLVLSVQAASVDAKNEGKLIHVSGRATTKETLKDPIFGVSAQGLKLSRNVSMYQWQQHTTKKTTKNTGGSSTTETTYSYNKEWSDSHINSKNFKQ